MIEEFEKFHKIISKIEEPFYIPLKLNKTPDFKGKKWEEARLSFEDAKKRISERKAVGIVFYDKVICIDLDIYKLKNKDSAVAFVKGANTLTVKTPSGGYHLYFVCENARNMRLRGLIAEIRAKKMYVVAPGSFCTSINNPKGDYYRIVNYTEPKQIEFNVLKDTLEKTIGGGVLREQGFSFT